MLRSIGDKAARGPFLWHEPPNHVASSTRTQTVVVLGCFLFLYSVVLLRTRQFVEANPGLRKFPPGQNVRKVVYYGPFSILAWSNRLSPEIQLNAGKMGAPWIDPPTMLYSSREMMCMLTDAQCAFLRETYHNWYIADLVYGRGTVYLFVAAIAACAAGFGALKYAPAGLRAKPSWQKLVALVRFSTYRRYEVRALRYQTPTIGVMLLLGLGLLFFLLMTVVPQPYYWPNTPEVNFGDSPPLATRGGWMALAGIPFLILFASKANPIATLTGVSHEKLIVFHTFTAWAVLALALVHTFPFIVYSIKTGTMMENWGTSSYYWTGVVALIAQGYLTFMSVPWIRNKCYEFFKLTHWLAALVFMVFLFIHCDFTLTSADYFFVTAALYGVAWSYSQMKTYFDHGIRRRATITRISDHVLRVDVPVGPFMLWKPGQHVFLRFLTLGLHGFTAHPFTVCSLPDSDKLIGEPKSVMTFYVKPRGGFTGRLATKAVQGGGGSITVPVLLEGAYGGPHGRPLTDYDRALVVACGSGAGFSLPFVMQWIRAAAAASSSWRAGTSVAKEEVAKKKMTVLIATRDEHVVEWYEAALNEFCRVQRLEMPTAATLEVLVYLTISEGQASTSFSGKGFVDGDGDYGTSAPATPSYADIFKVQRGRPQIREIARGVTMENHASVALAACGPATVLQAVRDEAAEAELRILKSGAGPKEVYLYSEVFGW